MISKTAPTRSAPLQAETVCIIGAGPGGLAAAKYLIAENTFSKIAIIEQRGHVGGLWNHIALPDPSSADATVPIPVPQTDPSYGNGEPEPVSSVDKSKAEFITPLYDRLETNIPCGLIGFSDQSWPEGTPLFPRHDEVLTYLNRYAKSVRDYITFNTQVVDVVKTADGEKWAVTTTHLPSQTQKTEIYDAVIVANGHYNVPFIPPVAGMERWNDTHPNRISHSKYFRRPESYTGKKVIVVGNSASGSDIGRQISDFCAGKLIFSTRSESYLFSPDPKYSMKPEIVEYLPSSRGVRFKDGSEESEIDHILYCTGYLYSYPFLSSLQNSPAPLIGTGERVQNLYQHLFYRPDPSLVFLGLPQKVIPFPFSEAQAAVVAKVFSGKISLPDEETMAQWERGVVEENGDGRKFHLMPFPKDADHINFLHDWAMSAGQEGKEPPRWEEKQYWMRERFPEIRREYLGRGEGRYEVKTLEEVGYEYEKWKEEQKEKESGQE